MQTQIELIKNNNLKTRKIKKEIDSFFEVSNDRDIDEEVERLFQYYRKNGFPNYDINEYNPEEELNKIIKFNEETIFNNKDLGQTMHGCGFLWTFFPHWIDVKYKTEQKTLRENWDDDEKLRSLILKTYKWQLKFGRGVFTTNRIRQNAKVYCSKQSVSNFRPTVAKYLYNQFGNKGVVWDMSAGWGGRLLGFLASDCKKYIGTEPSLKSFNGLFKIKKTYDYIDKEIELNCVGSETIVPAEPNSVDLCFTSPPYFDTEEYSQEATQSFKAYPTKELWIDKFMKQTIKNCKVALKDNGYLIINISNTKTNDWIEQETIKIALKEGFKFIDTYYLVLSSIAGKGKKREPIFIFRKTTLSEEKDIKKVAVEKGLRKLRKKSKNITKKNKRKGESIWDKW